MSLRSSILTHALPLVRTQSFTRQSLVSAYLGLRDDGTAPSSVAAGPSSSAGTTGQTQAEGVIDELFGPGRSAVLELVRAWERAGAEQMRAGGDRPEGSLSHRLGYSAAAGPSLLEAYALLASPAHTPSIPIPRTVLALLPALARNLSLSFPALTTLNRLPLLSVHPLGPISYAWRIADEAVLLSKPGEKEKGVHGEGLGAGPEWYASRLGLALVYLASEAHLLLPAPTYTAATNPRLPDALDALSRNLERYDDIHDLLTTTSLLRVRSGASFALGPLVSTLASGLFRAPAAASPPRWPRARGYATAAAAAPSDTPAPPLPPVAGIAVTAPSLDKIKAEGYFDDDVALVPPAEARLVISPPAIQQLVSITARESADAIDRGLALRVGVDSGGCHGYQYTMALTEERGVDDYVFQPQGVRSIPVVVDLVSLGLVKGATLDFATELIGSSFRILDNPQAKEGGSCGCGISWEAKI
ncbi:[4Fe-4S] proteins maturation [Cryptotrichosporon argae]